MSSELKCKNCGSSDVEFDSDIGETICTHCGSVLHANNFVPEVRFNEDRTAVLGKFVWTNSNSISNDKMTKYSEITMRKAREAIIHLSHQLCLNSRCIDMAIDFFQTALMKKLTVGRPSTYVYGACVYMSCRIEGTNHVLIDISETLQISRLALGKTYLKLCNLLAVNIPIADPCVYIMRFANKMEFGDKTPQVIMTAQSIVERMKKDCIHTGRKMAGYCGAALLMAARIHEFNRTPTDIVRIVKVHEPTIHKRLLEFGDTPSSKLTFDAFINVDLDSGEDPPAFKKACKQNLQQLQLSEQCETFIKLQETIDSYLEREIKNINRKVETTEQCSSSDGKSFENTDTNLMNENLVNGELDLEGLDDDEINLYILSPQEVKNKEIFYNAMFSDEETTMDKKEAKTIQTNISNKINYDVLKELPDMKSVHQSTYTTEEQSSTSTSCEVNPPTNKNNEADSMACSGKRFSDPESDDSEKDEAEDCDDEIGNVEEIECLSLATLLRYSDEDNFTYNEFE